MNTWKVILTNDEEVGEIAGDFGSCRKLKIYCEKNSLAIKKFFYNQEEYKPRIMAKSPEALFVIQDGMFVASGGVKFADFRRGLGAISFEFHRYRISWRDSEQKHRNYNEVRKDIPSFYKEICIAYKPEEE